MSSRVFWGALLISLGGLFLLSNFGVLPWGVWGTLIQAWPLLLVLWGASILLRPMGRLGALITAVVVVVGLGGVVAYSYAYHPQDRAGYGTGSVALSQPLSATIDKAEINLDFGAGTIKLDGTASAANLAEGTLGYVAKKPTVQYYDGNGLAQLQVTMATGTWVSVPGYKAPTWDIHLNPKPTYTLDLDTGACSADLNLSALKVTDLVLSTGASDTTVTFSDPGQNAKARFEFGAASVKVRVPRSVGVRVTLSAGLVGTNLSTMGFTKSGSDWVSSGYNEKTNHLDIQVNAGASSFNLDWID